MLGINRFQGIVGMNKLKYVGLGILSSVVVFFLIGIPTAIIPNSFFTRMVEITKLDVALLVISSLLLGSYIGLNYYSKRHSKKCDNVAYGTGFASIFILACPVCNKLILFLLGVSGALTYWAPIRPIFGVINAVLIAGLVFYKTKTLSK